MRLVIVTGMSGAGKSQALKIFEDFGFYCVDNLPLALYENFVAWAMDSREHDDIALGLDVRSGKEMGLLAEMLKQQRFDNFIPEILFLDASDETLTKRFKETRRSHPLETTENSLEDGIIFERELMSRVKSEAKYVIDTSFLLTKELRSQLSDIYMHDKEYKNLNVTIMSFGFKYGVPADVDLVFDVRFLPNPFYVDDLKRLTGNDEPVASFVKASDVTAEFLVKLNDMIDFLLPNYVAEGKNQLVIAIGCTGGRHRSVTVANELYKCLMGKGYGLKLEHREL